MENSHRASILEVIFKVLESEHVPSSFAFTSFNQDQAVVLFTTKMILTKCAYEFEKRGIPHSEWYPLTMEQVYARFQQRNWAIEGSMVRSPLIKPRKAAPAYINQLAAIQKAWSGIVVVKDVVPSEIRPNGKAHLGGIVRTGTGFFVDLDVVVTDITAVWSERPIVQVSSGHQIYASVIAADRAHCLALLKLDSAIPINNWELSLSTVHPRFQEHLVEAGYSREFPGDGLDRPAYTHAMYWESVPADLVRTNLAEREDAQRMLYAAAVTDPNSSTNLVGSPVFNETGQVIGMHNRAGEQASFITPASDIAALVAWAQEDRLNMGDVPPSMERLN
jgi:hypothetical protein